MQRGKATNRFLDFYLGIPVLNLLASLRRRGKNQENPSRIGLLVNPALGDTLLASAAVQDIRNLFPAAELILFATKVNIAAAELLPEIDVIEVLPITHPIKSIRIIRSYGLDMMLDFTSWQRLTAFYTLMSGAHFTVGFKREKQYRHRGYDETVPHRGDCHELENLHRFTRAIGVKTESAPRLQIPGGALPEVVLQCAEIVVFHAWASGARSWLREWPDERWVDLARQLMTQGRVFLLTGSSADQERCYALREQFIAKGIPVDVMIGRGGISEIARVLNHAEMLVSVNTGIMHLGAILGVPTVSINGPTAVHRWGPTGPRVANVCPPDGSGGFLDLGFEYRGRSENVTTKISVDDVLRATQQFGIASSHALVAKQDVAQSKTNVALPTTAYENCEPVQYAQRLAEMHTSSL